MPLGAAPNHATSALPWARLALPERLDARLSVWTSAEAKDGIAASPETCLAQRPRSTSQAKNKLCQNDYGHAIVDVTYVLYAFLSMRLDA